jgi:hypothetical protein
MFITRLIRNVAEVIFLLHSPVTSLMRTIYACLCGALILFAALVPPAISILDKAGF